MPTTSLPTPILVTRPGDLRRLVDDLTRQPILAVDTESNSLYAYHERVCLIQFSTPQTDYLVDPLALSDLTPLAPIFADARIEKVFHAAEYDVICLKRDFGFSFRNLFDTMAAMRILGKKKVGLGDLLRAEFGVSPDKRNQRANWGQRPLPPHLLAYARMDTHYLIPLRDRLQAELITRNLWPLAAEDFGRVCHVNGRSSHNDQETCWRVNGVRELSPQQAAVLSELCNYRDQVARSYDRPLFKVLGDNTLMFIAATCPHTIDQLKQLPGMSEGQIYRYGKAILDAVQRGLQAEPMHPPRSPRPGERFLERLEVLKEWRKQAARQMGVESDVVLPRDILYTIAEQNPPHLQELAEILGDVPWRLERFGSQILEVLGNH